MKKVVVDDESRSEKMLAFTKWFKSNIKGRERGEAQIFLDRLLKSFGNDGALEAGASFEDPVKKKSGKTGFIDLVWKPRVIIEMKGRGENLRKHYAQAAEYWFQLVPNRPQYMVLCNFDEFWIFDLNVQVSDPVHILRTDKIADDFAALAFLFKKAESPIFNNNNVEVTERAAGILGNLYQSLLKRNVDQERAQRFVLQMVVALFSEDVGLIPEYTVYRILEGVIKEPTSSEESFKKDMTALFKAMAEKSDDKKPKRFSNIPYFNGGLFCEVAPVELKFKEIDLLVGAAKEDWSKVRPSIFGSIFESSLDPKKRHEHGVHFTHEIDIYKIVNPTIVRPFRERIEKSKNKIQLKQILKEIAEFRVLDPACGSGNFLYIAFRELRRLEVEILELLDKNFDPKQMRGFTLISPKNFFGIDTNKFGLELAKIALSIGRKLSADEFNINEKVLPFDDLDDNFNSGDALFTKWPEVDAIIGNPPFLGGRNFRRDRGDEYVEKLYGAYPSVRGQVDYCVYWFRIAQDSKAKRVGLVGTNSIAQGQSREASLEYLHTKGGRITNAISTQVWSGEANVHVCIVNWTKISTEKIQAVLDGNQVKEINSSLGFEASYTAQSHRLAANMNLSFQSCELHGKGFAISKSQAAKWIKEDSNNKKVLKPMLDGRGLVNPNAELDWVIDFNDMTIEEASNFKLPFAHIKSTVKPTRDKNKRKARRVNWWKFGEKARGMRKALVGLQRYFALPKIAKYTIFQSVDSRILPCEANMVVASNDFYVLGVLNSKLHRDWVKAQASTLKADTRYTNTTCFETFPFIWQPPKGVSDKIRKIMQELEAYRVTTCKEKKCTITDLYNEFFNEPLSQLFVLHQELDKRVCDLYGFKWALDANFNDELFKLNQQIAIAEGNVQGR